MLASQLGADLLGFRALQGIEDGQRLLPGLLRSLPLACGLEDIAQVTECLALAEPIAQFSEQAECPVVAWQPPQ